MIQRRRPGTGHPRFEGGEGRREQGGRREDMDTHVPGPEIEGGETRTPMFEEDKTGNTLLGFAVYMAS